MENKMRRFLSILIAVSMCVFLLAGCSDDASGQGGYTVGSPYSLTIGTGGTAGTYYVVAAAMAQTVNEKSDFLNVTVQATKGSVENLNLTNAGEIEIGMSNADGVYWATTGTGTYEGNEQNLSAMMSLYMSCGQMAVMSGSGIESYGDLAGKKVCLGPPSTTIVEMSKAILRAYGIDPENDIQPYYLAFDEGLAELQDGTLDATFFVAAAPTSAMVNATAGGAVKLVDVPVDILEAVAAENPYFSLYTIPAGTYGAQSDDIHTLKIMTEYFVSDDVPDEVVYEFVKVALENVGDYVDAHTACLEINPETAADTMSRLHPGAEKYYQEIGVR